MRANEQDSILSSNRRQPQSLLSGAYDSTCERWMLLGINLSGTAGYFVLSHGMIIFYETRRFFNYERRPIGQKVLIKTAIYIVKTMCVAV